MRILQTLVLAAALSVGLAAPKGFAQTAPSREALQAAREFASLASFGVVAQMVTKLSDQTWPTVAATLRLKNPSIDAGTLAELRREYERLQVSTVLDGVNDAAPVYARYFTAQELRELAAFYRTPVGAKAMAVMPHASAELLQGLAPRIEVLAANVNQRFSTILQQRGYVP
jgi:hypothetical protein